MSASIVAMGYDGSYKALRLDLTGRVDSAGLDGAEAAGTCHRNQAAECKSLLVIETRARAARPVKFPQLVLLSSAKSMHHHHQVASGPAREEGRTVDGGRLWCVDCSGWGL